jgi:hypothetical protein
VCDPGSSVPAAVNVASIPASHSKLLFTAIAERRLRAIQIAVTLTGASRLGRANTQQNGLGRDRNTPSSRQSEEWTENRCAAAPMGLQPKGNSSRTCIDSDVPTGWRVLPDSTASTLGRRARWRSRRASARGPRGRRHPSAWFLQRRDEAGHVATERRHALLNERPHDLEVHAEVLVNEDVPEASEVGPRDLRVRRLESRTHPLHRLANDLEVADGRVLENQ